MKCVPVGRGTAPEIGGEAPAAKVVKSGKGVSTGFPEEIAVKAGTVMPGTCVGVGMANVGEKVDEAASARAAR